MTMLKPLRKIAEESIAFPVTADEVLEFHAARLILLFRNCGIGGRIDGLTKMAKLDFFVRYPVFFARLDTTAPEGLKNRVESSMIRFHYGPWDPRYYRVLTYLEAKGLIGVTKSGRGYQFELSPLGKDARPYKPDNILSQGRAKEPQPFRFRGKLYDSWEKNSHWKANYPAGM